MGPAGAKPAECGAGWSLPVVEPLNEKKGVEATSEADDAQKTSIVPVPLVSVLETSIKMDAAATK